MQCKDNKWGIPVEMLNWILPIVLIGVLAAIICPLLSRRNRQGEEIQRATEQMEEGTNTPPEQAVSSEE